MKHILKTTASRLAVADTLGGRSIGSAEQIKIAQYIMKKLQMGTLQRAGSGATPGVGVKDLPPVPEVTARLKLLGWQLVGERFRVQKWAKQGVEFELTYYLAANFLAAPTHQLV